MFGRNFLSRLLETGMIALLFLAVLTNLALPAALAAEVGHFSLDPSNTDNTNASFDALVEQYKDIVGWGDNPLDSMAPVRLPNRQVEIQRDSAGNPIVEVEDPEAAAFDEKMKAIDRVPPPRPVDEDAIRLAKAYHTAKSAPKPYITTNGRLNFYYGTMTPRVVCRPLRLTDIELEAGEQIKNVNISDSARWSISGAWSGAPGSLVTHIIVKPQLPDIAANLLLHTDRRTYSLELVSVAEGEYMPSVGFVYPEEMLVSKETEDASWKGLFAQYEAEDRMLAKAMAGQTSGEQDARKVDPANIYLDYTVKVTRGQSTLSWKPKSVYDANGKTYIVMPETMKLTEAPIFFIKQGTREKLTNYRVLKNVYIIDRLFDLGILTVGKDRVAIYRKSPVGGLPSE
ncbi:MAG: TrbG/VirB9 family P-type conjugative transfer protein [Synergistaceae bacterium]|jgi:type IV secretion system protein VirB9|nr:TrbG/VirB9 family P-type conjugative transfer protein [Synergistaceae bacterium]